MYRDPINIQCRVNNIPVDFEVDSGAAVSVISENVARKVNAQITRTSHRVLGYSGGQIDLVGEALLPISYNNVSVVHKFLIVTGDKNNLFGRDLFSQFHIHIVVNPHKLNAIQRSISVLSEFSSYFNDDFQSCVKEPVHLNVAPNAKPVYAKARQIPIRLKDKVKSELDRLTSEGILTRVYSATWASPIVTIFKQDGSLRLCADFSSTVNKHLLPINSPLITIDEAITSVGSAKVFSKLDLSQAFLQLPVQSSSRKYLVINTPEGLFQFNYLPFGLTASPGIFQAFISKVLANIPGVLCYQDDILLMSSEVESHNKILKEVLSRLKDAGLKLNVNKCNFFVEQVEYLGFVFNEKGVHPKPGKISAIIDAPVPKDVKQVQAFIGLCNFYSRFISNFAALMSPLYALLKKNARFCLSDECQFAFDTVKNVFAEGHILQHFNVNYETCLETDSSSYGVGAVLLQRASKDAPWLPIQFASQTLNAAEKNYSQLEREGLSVVFGLDKLKKNIGSKFTIFNYHKPLHSLFAKDKPVSHTCSARVLRWALKLSQFDYEFVYSKGCDNVQSDFLSRLPLRNTAEESEPYELIFSLNYVSHNVITYETVKKHSEQDPDFVQLRKFIKYGCPSRISNPVLSKIKSNIPFMTVFRDVLCLKIECLFLTH